MGGRMKFFEIPLAGAYVIELEPFLMKGGSLCEPFAKESFPNRLFISKLFRSTILKPGIEVQSGVCIINSRRL